MELKIKVCTNDSCKVIILDDTGTGENGYLPESSSVIVKNRFKYSDTVSIDVLQHNKLPADAENDSHIWTCPHSNAN